MNEATCKAAVTKVMRAELTPRGGVVWRHEDSFAGGIPDLSASLGPRTVWAEFKLHRPGRRAKLTALQGDALDRTHGFLVEYALARDGRLSVVVTRRGVPQTMTVSVPSVRGGPVHRVVAAALLAGLEVQLSGGRP